MTDFETLVTGCGLIEGPRIDEENRLYFSDVHNGGVFCRQQNGEVETLIPKRRGVGGIALHENGGLVVSGKNICHVKNGISTILYENPEVLGYNDIQPDPRGRLHFCDIRYNVFDEKAERLPGTARRLELDGSMTELYDGILLTNGMGFSPDGRKLYHCDTGNQCIWMHEMSPDGRCLNRQVFTEPKRGRPDGMAVDIEGYVWVACYAGGCVARYAPNGKVDLYLEVPATAVTSLEFGGYDNCDLYVTSADNRDDPGLKGSIFRTRVEVPGLSVPMVRVKI